MGGVLIKVMRECLWGAGSSIRAANGGRWDLAS